MRKLISNIQTTNNNRWNTLDKFLTAMNEVFALALPNKSAVQIVMNSGFFFHFYQFEKPDISKWSMPKAKKNFEEETSNIPKKREKFLVLLEKFFGWFLGVPEKSILGTGSTTSCGIKINCVIHTYSVQSCLYIVHL